ncbi:MAG: hypothetical protein IPH05_07705 [Flavobacteriales bacterium]|nr:hypothetical protein [Flavobacteriales bacterium]
MKKNILMTSLLCLAVTMTSIAQKLPKFGADMGMKSAMGKEVRVPYTDLASYYGYVQAGATPDEERDGKKFYYLYLWVPVAAPELGIRMISPIPSGMEPGEGDFTGADYEANKADDKNYFDTWITLEKAAGVTSVDGIAESASAEWNTFGKNDDSSELPEQPSGSKYNSQMRITSDVSDPLKALTMGLYRIGFTTYKKGEVQGSFLAQVGAPLKLPGSAISATIEGLLEQVKK